jgi:hypothetical protein
MRVIRKIYKFSKIVNRWWYGGIDAARALSTRYGQSVRSRLREAAEKYDVKKVYSKFKDIA